MQNLGSVCVCVSAYLPVFEWLSLALGSRGGRRLGLPKVYPLPGAYPHESVRGEAPCSYWRPCWCCQARNLGTLSTSLSFMSPSSPQSLLCLPNSS